MIGVISQVEDVCRVTPNGVPFLVPPSPFNGPVSILVQKQWQTAPRPDIVITEIANLKSCFSPASRQRIVGFAADTSPTLPQPSDWTSLPTADNGQVPERPDTVSSLLLQ